MPLRESVELDIRNARNQLNQLESKFDQLRTPITIPVELTGEQAIDSLRRQISAAEQDDIDIEVNTFGLDSADDAFRDLNQQIDRTEDELQQAQRRADTLGAELQETGRLGSSAFAGIRSAVGPLVATFAAGLGVREIVDQFRQAIDAATSLTESMNAVNVVFGEGAAAIQKFGEDSAANVGLAASQVNELVTPIGALLQNFGLDGREAADAALELTNRAADLASVFNTDVNDALAAIGSALRGEQEPIRRFGVNLNAAALDAKALELGLVGVGEEVTQSIRGQAAYAEVLEQTAFAAGDFAATADSAANKQRILSAELETARATVGEALLPLYEDLLGIMPSLIEAFESLAPVVGLAASGFQGLAGDIVPIIDLVGSVAQGIGLAGDAISNADIGNFASDLLEVAGVALNPISAFSLLGEEIGNLVQWFQIGITNDDLEEEIGAVAEQAEAGADPVLLLSEAFGRLSEQGIDAVSILGDIGAAAGVSDEEFIRFVQNLLLARGALQLTNEDVAILRDLLRELGGDPTGGFGFGAILGAETTGVDEARVTLDSFRDSVGATFSEIEAQRALEDAFGDLPTVVTNFSDLQSELEATGQSLSEFLTASPDDTGIIGIFDDIETRALETLATLQEVAPELTGTLLGAFGDAPVDEETGKIEADIESFFQFLDEKAGEQAQFEFDLSIVASQAPDLAQFLKDQGLAATDIAAAFASNLEDAAKAEALIDGAEGMATEVAEQFASFLETLTPEELANVAVFGAENFVSNPIRQQLQESASEMAQVLSEALAAETISPAMTLDLSNVQITGAIDTGQIPVGNGEFGDQAPGTVNIPITVNNPTTLNLETSVSQAAQTVAAVASSLPSIR